MKNLWNDATAEALVADYAKKGVDRDLALRVYTTRLLGGEPRLVLHGGGNTSVKSRVTDLIGDSWDVLCVKGSGWDMAVIEPQGLPAVKLGALEEWTIINNNSQQHPFQIHTNDFQVISINDEPFEASSHVDTVNLPADGKVTIRIPFLDFTGKFVYHCHILPHEDSGMMQNIMLARRA